MYDLLVHFGFQFSFLLSYCLFVQKKYLVSCCYWWRFVGRSFLVKGEKARAAPNRTVRFRLGVKDALFTASQDHFVVAVRLMVLRLNGRLLLLGGSSGAAVAKVEGAQQVIELVNLRFVEETLWRFRVMDAGTRKDGSGDDNRLVVDLATFLLIVFGGARDWDELVVVAVRVG